MTYKHINTGQEIEVDKNHKLYDVVSNSPSWKKVEDNSNKGRTK